MSTVMVRSTTRVSSGFSVELGRWCLTGCCAEFVKVWNISSQRVALNLTMMVSDDAVEVRKETCSLYFSAVSFVRYLFSEQPVYGVSKQRPSHKTASFRAHSGDVWTLEDKHNRDSLLSRVGVHRTQAPMYCRSRGEGDVMTKTPMGSIQSSSGRGLRCCG